MFAALRFFSFMLCVLRIVLVLGPGLMFASTTMATPSATPDTSAAAPQRAATARPDALTSGAKKRAKSHRPGRPAQASFHSYAQRSDAMHWAEQAASQWDLPADWVRAQIGQAQHMALIEQLVLPAPNPSAKNWAAYRNRFVEPRRIEAGAAFWRRHQASLERAQAIYGVPASLIVGVIGVETLYGQHMGGYRILDALATLAFDFPQAHPRAAARQSFFQDELGHFLRMAHRSGQDAKSYRGSYAGAMGLPQFMPSSWGRYAVDFDGDGRIDLFNSPADAIGSVANYFKAFQWKTDVPTHYAVVPPAEPSDLAALLAPDILPMFSVEAFTAKGAQLQGPALQHTGPLALIELHNGQDPPSYVAGTENFYVVTRYNWSSYYAMAVIELGQAVAQHMGR